jgi:protein-S-isoprenylcysteine O-methyltransferase Ste14
VAFHGTGEEDNGLARYDVMHLLGKGTYGYVHHSIYQMYMCVCIGKGVVLEALWHRLRVAACFLR